MQESYIARMNQAIKHKRYFVDVIKALYQQKNQSNVLVSVFEEQEPRNISILDFGCGSGLLTATIAREFPYANVTGYDKCLEMVEIARERFDAERLSFTSSIDSLQKDGYDYIVLSSVLHEVYSKFSDLGVSAISTFLNSLETHLKPDGYIISRDNYVSDSTNNTLLNMTFVSNSMAQKAVSFMKEDFKLTPDRLKQYYGRLGIDTHMKTIFGIERGVKEFLNKFTWGEESLMRESQESLFCISPQDWKLLVLPFYTIVAQYNYIDNSYLGYIREIVEIPESFPTHQWTILQYNKKNIKEKENGKNSRQN